MTAVDDDVVIRQRFFSREFVVRFRRGLFLLPLIVIGLAHGGGGALVWSLVAVGAFVVLAYPLTAWIVGSSSLGVVDGTVRHTSWLRPARSCPISALAEVVEIPVTLYRPDLGFRERWLFFVAPDHDVALHAYAGFYSPRELERFRDALGLPWESVDRSLTPAQVRRRLPHAFSWPAAHWVLTLLGLLVSAYLVAVLVLAVVYAVTQAPNQASRIYCYRHPNRETGLSCTECDRPICTECLRMTPVGPRCPDHATQGQPRVRAPARERTMRRVTALSTEQPYVTWVLIGINVIVYLISVSRPGGMINSPSAAFLAKWGLYGPAVANGDWWRLITAAFLHANVLHIGLNMLALVWLGAPVERYLGHLQYLGLYLVAGLAGSAGALIATPTGLTVGASGAIFGILGALLIIEYQATGNIAGQAFTLILINLAFSFTVSGISVGGHIGGLVGGIAAALALTRFGRSSLAYGRPGIVGMVALLGVGILSIAISYWKVKGYA